MNRVPSPNRDRRLSRLVIAGLAAAALTPVGAGLGSCDSTATLFPQKVLFQSTQIISAYPAQRQGDGTWRRQCAGGPVDGIITNTLFISTQRKSTNAADLDRDNSIRPNDVIDTRTVEGGLPDDINLSNTGNLDLNIDCIDPQPQPNPNAGGCQGAAPSVSLDRVSYHNETSQRRSGHNVLILIDQSGSVGGLVDENNGFQEGRPGDFLPPQNFGSLASDRTSLRLAATRRLVRSLNTEDRYGIIAFGENVGSGGLRVPCTDAQGSLVSDLDLCFGKTNDDIWLSPNGLDSLQGQTEGRSNLWDAVDKAYTYLEGLDDRNRSNHVIVITDGPDTASVSENLGRCQSAFSSVPHTQVLDRVETASNNPNAVPIRIHFVQFEAIGYRGRDPRQMEVSCVSGGHYQFINSRDFPAEQTAPFQEAMELAVTNVRLALGGYWELAAGAPAYVSNAGAPTGTPIGMLYALSGILQVRETSQMVRTTQPFPFGVGQGEGATSATNWDRRPSIRKPCGSATECGAGGPAGACQVICSPETSICPGGATGVQKNDTFACDIGGQSGNCCDGTCMVGGFCDACTP